jgi:hypothetical protein
MPFQELSILIIISLCQGPKPAVSAGRTKTFRCFVVGRINCHSESENFLKFLLTRVNFSRFNPGDVSWISAQGYVIGHIFGVFYLPSAYMRLGTMVGTLDTGTTLER